MDTPSCPCDAREQVEQNIYAPVYSRVSCLCLNDILSATESLRAALETAAARFLGQNPFFPFTRVSGFSCKTETEMAVMDNPQVSR